MEQWCINPKVCKDFCNKNFLIFLITAAMEKLGTLNWVLIQNVLGSWKTIMCYVREKL